MPRDPRPLTRSCADGHPLPAGCQSTGRSQHYYMSEVISPALQQEQKQLQQQQQHILSIAEYAHVYFSDEWNASPYDGEASLSAYPRNLSNMPQYSDLKSNRIAFLSLPPPPSPLFSSLYLSFSRRICEFRTKNVKAMIVPTSSRRAPRWDRGSLYAADAMVRQQRPASFCNGVKNTLDRFTDLPCNYVCALVYHSVQTLLGWV